MKIYTKKGDGGTTSLFGGERVDKDSLRIEAYGTVDELNSQLGVVRSLQPAKVLLEILEQLQNDLFVLGADLATPNDTGKKGIKRIGLHHAEALEKHIDRLDVELEPLSSFVLPAGGRVAAALHVARTVCRRAERSVVRLKKDGNIGDAPVVYLNRLSDLLFVMARYANKLDGVAETPWQPG